MPLDWGRPRLVLGRKHGIVTRIDSLYEVVNQLNLTSAGYRIISAKDITVTIVVLRQVFALKYVRPLFCGPSIRLYGEGKDSQRLVRSGSSLVHLDRPPACVATAGPEHRCFDRRCPRELG